MSEDLRLLHYKNSLMFSREVNCCAIEITFKGKFIGESKLSDDWYVATSRKKIICISFNGNQNVNELFVFDGAFTIRGIKLITEDLVEIPCASQKLDIDHFGRGTAVFDSAQSYFSDYSSDHRAINTIDNIDIYKNNLFTKQDEFYFENGENYFGAYHQHSNSQAMTEAEHNSDSVNIYRKDQDNKLYKPKPKRLKPVSIHKDMTPSRDIGSRYQEFVTSDRKSYDVEGEGGTGGGSGGYGA